MRATTPTRSMSRSNSGSHKLALDPGTSLLLPSSTTTLFSTLSKALRHYFSTGDERVDILTEMDHTIRFQQVDPSNIHRMRSLNLSLFPVNYSTSFYRGLLLPGQFAQLALYGNAYVGTIACRKQPLGFASCPTQQGELLEVYMMTLGVLAPYRRLGLGKQLLINAIEYAAQDPMVCKMVLHVQIDNDDALRFYHKHGFTTVRMVERYYRNIEPPHAYLLEYQIR